MKKAIGYFLQGLLYTLPISATIYVVYKAITIIDGIIPFNIPGLGILILLVSITLIGFLGGALISSRILKLEKLLDRVPLLKIIYTSVKDLLSAFVGKKKRFTEPVLVKMEGEVERIGFVTQKDLTHIGISSDKIGVYIPFSYAVTGNLIIVPKGNITPINGSSADIMKFIISGGVTEIGNENGKTEEEV
ncbi:MAG: DUF502 domain-containing protein [Flavobacteriales bacterium]|nr:DUF502 domain-containing protein [Flavobacteriales bacterium]